MEASSLGWIVATNSFGFKQASGERLWPLTFLSRCPGAKGFPLAFDLADGQEFAFFGESLDQFLDTENSILEAR